MIRSTLFSVGWGVFLVISLAACSDKNVEANADSSDPAPQTRSTDMASSSDNIEGTWELVAFQSGDATALNDDLVDVEVTASFASDGSVSGRSGCNRYRASIDFTDSGMQVGPFAGTKMACPGVRMEIEEAYTQAFTSARDYELAGDTLTLLDEDGTPLLRFERPADSDDEGRDTSEASGSASSAAQNPDLRNPDLRNSGASGS
jgi:heat shock protein HslJ